MSSATSPSRWVRTIMMTHLQAKDVPISCSRARIKGRMSPEVVTHNPSGGICYTLCRRMHDDWDKASLEKSDMEEGLSSEAAACAASGSLVATRQLRGRKSTRYPQAECRTG